MPKFAKIALQPASGTSLLPGGAPVTQLLKVENSSQGAKPRECQARRGSSGAARVWQLHRVGGQLTPRCTSRPRLFLPPSFHAVALKLKLLYTPEGAPEQVTEVTDVRNFPPTL